MQRDLQNEVIARYGDEPFYDIRRGQPSDGAHAVLDNQLAAHLKLRPELQRSFASVRYTLAYLVARVFRLSGLGEKLLEDTGARLPDQRDDFAKQPEACVDFVMEETDYFVSDRKEQRQQNPDAEPFDPKTIFKASAGIRPLERQVIQAVEAIARRADSDIWFDLEPERPVRARPGR